MGENLTIGFIGNPNCGKTTLFNAYTGANLKVANWPGVTVEKVEGAIKDHDMNIRLVDLPGTYSLTSYTMEEQVSRQFILSDEVDVIIDVADASALERNLYLTLQLLELGKPVVLALNMMDIVEKRGMEIDTHRLPEMLGIPVIPVSARKRTGLDTFKGIFGQPIGNYMKEYRIRQAAILLRQTQSTIAEIANKVGYENQSKFATAFRDVLKIPPAEYRKQNSGE